MTDSSSADANEDLTGQVIGDYHILRRLGSGGMAQVYLAEQQSLNRQLALKVLHARLADDASYVQRFLNEARAAALYLMRRLTNETTTKLRNCRGKDWLILIIGGVGG